ncbi:hypothetical protein F4813DRAFT_379745 [Daldinia decipiens]|uniref:uncharacterized protein n=1 Tax=Daldinia decipiens TaxID=326647 RepID=UPI0020C49A7D|nr:uncharacterized protein F4813DRAFT_379745 [Daldinia decipiens]KAI1659416.1 hypothetical protein F4813DRAFT_379745 [Daldinia decipiens]
MALDITYDQDLRVSRTPPIMKTTPRQPEPNGSRVVKKRSSPQLGDGLCDVFSVTIDSLAWTEDTSISSVDHETSSSVFTPSEKTSTIMSSTPGSSTGSIDFDLRLDSYDHIETPKHPASSIAHCESSRATSYTPSGVEQALYTPSSVSLDVSTSALTSPSPKLLQLSQILDPQGYLPYATPPRMPKEQTTKNPLITATTVRKIDSWFHDGKLPLLEAKDLVGSSQYLDLLDALNAQQKPHERDQVNVNLLPHIPQYSKLPLPNPLYRNVQSISPSPIEIMREQFYAKLRSHTDMNHAYSSLEAEADVHIFVDMSNIFIGFCESYKISRQIPLTRRISIPPFSFKTLALVMERARNVQKRVLAGSIYGVANNNPQTSWPPYFLEAEQLNYKMNVFSRVRKRKVSPNKPKGRGRTPTERSDEAGEISEDVTYEVRNGEQGVDENLHLNMMDSMWDNMSRPGTMVLATGDAAEAEFSGGFLQYAIRALEKGWKLELVTWKRPLSSAWTDPKFLKKYRNQFSIIFLDDFLEELQTGLLA